MYSVDLWRKHNFCLFKTDVNSLSRSTVSSNNIVSCSNSAFLWLFTSKIPNLMLPFWWNCVSHLLPSIWSVLLEYLYHFYIVMDYRIFLRCLFCCCLFSLWFSSLAKIFISSSKDVAASTAVVELITRAITLTIWYYSRELPVQ